MASVDAPAGLLVTADGALAFGNAAQLDRFPLPAVKAKDPVCFLNGDPTLQVSQRTACLASSLHNGPVEGSGQGGGLLRREQPFWRSYGLGRNIGQLGTCGPFDLWDSRSLGFWSVQQLQSG